MSPTQNAFRGGRHAGNIFDVLHHAGTAVQCHLNYSGELADSDRLTAEDVKMCGLCASKVVAARILAHGCYGVSVSQLRQMLKPHQLPEDELTISRVMRHIKECYAAGAGFAPLLPAVSFM